MVTLMCPLFTCCSKVTSYLRSIRGTQYQAVPNNQIKLLPAFSLFMAMNGFVITKKPVTVLFGH